MNFFAGFLLVEDHKIVKCERLVIREARFRQDSEGKAGSGQAQAGVQM